MNVSDLSLLIALDALLQESSVTRAARRVGLSTPAMSHALARMRDRLGDPLLVRAGQGMVLTTRAQILKPRVHSLVAQAEQLFTLGDTFSPETVDREFVINVTDYVHFVMGSALDRMVRQQAPQLRLRFVPATDEDAEALRQGSTDLAIGVYDELPPEIMTQILITDRPVCVLRKGHALAGQRMTLKRFVGLDHVQVAPRGRPGGRMDDLLHARGLERRVLRAVPSFQAAAALVADSDYVLTLSRRVAIILAASLELVIVEPPLKLEPYAVNLIWHPRVDADPAHRWLRELWVAAAAEVTGDNHVGARND
ncbi:family transcriptional regulator [Leptolyngbya sp. Heron Island J]|uniref:LysR family transcriptional regulator n=1 Tax=Leptolyngbya sp. Heron Island J TaxID=1385935 RepID=UPI0003B95A11|nr:LysR family transcriptional regulator [Leptolyngbya sp. Heron Island J]ESA36368.1 family transcriptional regulator [Leptolyngbya sp. Heron Island J]